MAPQYPPPNQGYDIPAYMDPDLVQHGQYPMTVTPDQMPEKKAVMVDVANFIRTRDALASAYIALSQSIDRAVKSYVEHTQVVISADASLNVSFLTQPFDQLAHTAQLAQQALHNQPHLLNTGAVPAVAGKAESPPVDGKGKRKKRAYKPRDPNAPKRPLTAYFRYLQEVRGPLGKELAEKAGGKTQKPGDLSKIATERWNALNKEEQQPYRDAYARALKDYEKAVEAYKAAGGKVEEGNVAEPDVVDPEEDVDGEDEVEEDEAEAVAANAKLATTAAAADEEDDDEESSSDESSSDDDDDEESAPPPPPPAPVQAPKTPKSAMKKSKTLTSTASTVAPTPQFSSINPDPAPPAIRTSASSKTSSSPERKRKTAMTNSSDASAGTEGPPKKKRGRKANAEKVIAGADAPAPMQPPPPPAEIVPSVGEAEKKKKRKKKGE